MSRVVAAVGAAPALTRTVGMAGAGFLATYALVSVVTGQQVEWLGNVAQLVPPLAFAALALSLARACRGQVRTFWNLSAMHGLVWALGQLVWTWYDFVGEVPVMSPTDPIFFASSIPLAAALYGRPERDRPQWLFNITLLDIVLIALFAAFVYIYFVVSIAVTDGPEEVYNDNLTQLFNARNLILAVWAGWVWRTAVSPEWRGMLGLYCAGLTLAFLGGVVYDVVEFFGTYTAGALWDLSWMAPYVVLSMAAAHAFDQRLFAPSEEAPADPRLPVMSIIAVALLVLIPTTDEIARRLLDVSPAAEALRTRLALTMVIPLGVVVVVREILSRRALAHAGRELAFTREQLAQKEKLAAVGQLVSGVAHELNNPLQGVLGYAELMVAARPGEAESEELKAIRENANRAAGIIRNLLTFAGRETPTRNWQQVNRIVHDALGHRRPRLQAEAIDVHLDLADRLPLIYIDGSRLELVIVNLLQNAEAAILARRLGLRSGVPPAAGPGEIVLRTRRQLGPDRLVIEVVDNGCGVPPEDLARVFDPFFTTRGTGEGTGLGLSVCYGIVREHGGQIRAENRDLGGAVFTVELPVVAEEYAPAASLSATPALLSDADVRSLGTRRARALVVDDEDSNAALVRRALEQAGYDVESTTLSRRALVMIERTPYDVVIADVKMPELSGQELYARACQIRPEMERRFLFITGDIDGEDTRAFLEQTHCGYFMKPFNLDRLTAAVDTLVGRRGDEGAIGVRSSATGG